MRMLQRSFMVMLLVGLIAFSPAPCQAADANFHTTYYRMGQNVMARTVIITSNGGLWVFALPAHTLDSPDEVFKLLDARFRLGTDRELVRSVFQRIQEQRQMAQLQ